MKESMSAKERAVRIELLRARAALERQSLVRGARGVGMALQPRSLLHSLFPRLASRSPAGWLYQAFALTRRYPLLASSVSTLLSGVGKRRRWWRIGAGLLLSWQVARTMGHKGD